MKKYSIHDLKGGKLLLRFINNNDLKTKCRKYDKENNKQIRIPILEKKRDLKDTYI